MVFTEYRVLGLSRGTLRIVDCTAPCMCCSMCSMLGQACRVRYLPILNPALPRPVSSTAPVVLYRTSPPPLPCGADRGGVAQCDGVARALTAEYQCTAAAPGRAVPVRAVRAVPAAERRPVSHTQHGAPQGAGELWLAPS